MVDLDSDCNYDDTQAYKEAVEETDKKDSDITDLILFLFFPVVWNQWEQQAKELLDFDDDCSNNDVEGYKEAW